MDLLSFFDMFSSDMFKAITKSVIVISLKLSVALRLCLWVATVTYNFYNSDYYYKIIQETYQARIEVHSLKVTNKSVVK